MSDISLKIGEKETQVDTLRRMKGLVQTHSVFTDLMEHFEAIQIADDAWALEIPIADGEPRYVVLELTGKKAGYDPFEDVDEWDFKKKERAERKATADANKAKKAGTKKGGATDPILRAQAETEKQ